MPSSQRQSRIRYETWGTTHIGSVIPFFEECVLDLSHAAVQRKPSRELDGRLCFISSAARTFELQAAIIGNVYLLVGVIDQKDIGAETEPPVIRGRAELVKVRGRCSC